MRFDPDLQKEVAALRRARRWNGLYGSTLLFTLGLFFSLGGLEMIAVTVAGACVLAWSFLIDNGAVLTRIYEQQTRNAHMQYVERHDRAPAKEHTHEPVSLES